MPCFHATAAVSLAFVACLLFRLSDSRKPSFRIDYDNNQFLKNGQPFRFLSGSIHYFRVVPELWYDRIYRLKAAGFNAIEVYINWNVHEEFPGQVDFSGGKNITQFVRIAQELDMVVLLRAGPYTCGEWDNGGLPWWLFKHKGIRTRSSDPVYLDYVGRWYAKLFPLIKPLLYKNGGPIITIQVENEYGWETDICDHKYMAFLRDLFISYVGKDVVLTTVDNGGADITCGSINGTYMTIDFGPLSKKDVEKQFAIQRMYSPRGPLVNTEFYPAWFSKWGGPWYVADRDAVVLTMAYMYNMNASFNFYMGHGGTNPGYMASGQNNGLLPFTSVTTSYDYDAPVSEDGKIREMFRATRTTIEVLTGKVVKTPIPSDPVVKSYGFVEVCSIGTVTDLLDRVSELSERVQSDLPLSYEELNFPYGFVLYEATAQSFGKKIVVEHVADRGYLMIDDVLAGIFIRGSVISLKCKISEGQKIRILVENQGRLNSGRGDIKGILSNVTIDGTELVTGWTQYPIDIDALFDDAVVFERLLSESKIQKRHKNPPVATGKKAKDVGFLPSIYIGKFEINDNDTADTNFNTTGWGKGQFFLNGVNIGRYWPTVGPQLSLYIPKSQLQLPTNYVILLELEKPNCNQEYGQACKINFVEERILENQKPADKVARQRHRSYHDDNTVFH